MNRSRALVRILSKLLSVSKRCYRVIRSSKGVSHDYLTSSRNLVINGAMPRQVRIEFAGAMYHVMARGDRREAIVQDEEDCRTFLRTLGEGCERAGFRVHAYALMTNHYHLLLETKEPNLSRGMGWLQNAFTRRINARHGLWGHVFGGRYKAIVVEPGNCFWALLDYIHPIRRAPDWSRQAMG